MRRRRRPRHGRHQTSGPHSKGKGVSKLNYVAAKDTTLQQPLDQSLDDNVSHPEKEVSYQCPPPTLDFTLDNRTVYVNKVKNLFISASTSTSSRRKCSIHDDQSVHFLCRTCDEIICPVCKLSDHEGHTSITLHAAAASARDRIQDANVGRIKDHAVSLRSAVKDLVEHQEQLKVMKEAAEASIHARHAKLVSLADECRDSALLELDALAVEIESTLQQNISELQREQNDVSNVQQEIEDMLCDGDDLDGLFDLEREVEEKWSSTCITQNQLSLLPTCTYSIHHTVSGKVKNEENLPDGCKPYTDNKKLRIRMNKKLRMHMQTFIGQSTKKQHPVQQSTPGVRMKPAFQCCQDPDAYIRSVCPAGGGKLTVSFETKLSDKTGLLMRTESFFEDGRPSKSFDFGLGTMLKRGQGYFWHLPLQRNVLWHKVSCLSSKSEEGYFLALIDGECCIFHFDARASRLANLFTWFSDPDAFCVCVHAHSPVAFDASDSSKLFVLIDDDFTPVRKVRLYKFGVGNLEESEDEGKTVYIIGPSYKPPVENFYPSDVCFFKLYGKEVLLVSDQANHTIHVVHIDSDLVSCTFERFLVCDDQQMHHPTALNTDDRGRLWVACKGGQLLTVVPDNH